MMWNIFNYIYVRLLKIKMQLHKDFSTIVTYAIRADIQWPNQYCEGGQLVKWSTNQKLLSVRTTPIIYCEVSIEGILSAFFLCFRCSNFDNILKPKLTISTEYIWHPAITSDMFLWSEEIYLFLFLSYWLSALWYLRT